MRFWRDLTAKEKSVLIKWKTKKFLKKHKKDIAKQQAVVSLMIGTYPDSWDEIIWFKKIDGKTKIKRKRWPWK